MLINSRIAINKGGKAVSIKAIEVALFLWKITVCLVAIKGKIAKYMVAYTAVIALIVIAA